MAQKKKKVCAEQASLRLLRVRHSGASLASSLPEAPQGQVHMEAVGSELRRHTGAHTCPHTHTQKESYWTTLWWW